MTRCTRKRSPLAWVNQWIIPQVLGQGLAGVEGQVVSVEVASDQGGFLWADGDGIENLIAPNSSWVISNKWTGCRACGGVSGRIRGTMSGPYRRCPGTHVQENGPHHLPLLHARSTRSGTTRSLPRHLPAVPATTAQQSYDLDGRSDRSSGSTILLFGVSRCRRWDGSHRRTARPSSMPQFSSSPARALLLLGVDRIVDHDAVEQVRNTCLEVDGVGPSSIPACGPSLTMTACSF